MNIKELKVRKIILELSIEEAVILRNELTECDPEKEAVMSLIIEELDGTLTAGDFGIN